MKFSVKVLAGLSVIALIGATGCSALDKEVQKKIDSQQVELDKAKLPVKSKFDMWFPFDLVEPEVQLKTDKELKLEAEQYTLRGYYDEINNLSTKVSELIGIPIVVEQGITNRSELAGSAATSETSSGVASTDTSSDQVKQMFSYSGNLKGLLDVVASRFNINWEWQNDGEKIRMYKTKTKTFKLHALAGQKTYRSIVGKSSSASENAESQFESGVSFSEMDMWESIKESIEAMLSADGKVVSSPSTSLFVVTDTPQQLKQVEEYINEVNDGLLKQVVINVKILSVDVSDSENYGIDWKLIGSSINRGISGSLTSNISAPLNASNFAFSIIDGGTFNGTELFINALKEQAKISSVQDYNAITTNRQAAPISITTTERILGQSSTALDGGQSVSTQELEDFTVGFNLSVLPNIINGEEMLLQFALDISRELDSKTVTSGDSTYHLPKKESRAINREVKIKSGSTLVITGFEQANLSSEKSGVGKWLGALGSNVKAQDGKSTIVVLLEPQIMEH